MDQSILKRVFVILTTVLVLCLIALTLFLDDIRVVQLSRMVESWRSNNFKLNDTSSSGGWNEIHAEGKITKPRKATSVVKIALYHPYHGMLKRKVSEFNSQKCYYKNCQVYIHDKIGTEPIANANAVIFQGGHMPPELPRRKQSDQVFILQNFETPQYLQFTNLRSPIFMNFFNWTMTYRLDSDIPFPYGTVIPKTNHKRVFKKMLELEDHVSPSKWLEIKSNTLSGKQSSTTIDERVHTLYTTDIKDYTSIFRAKSRPVAWLVSHCKTASKREKYAKMMSKHIDVDIYGSCSTLTCEKSVKCNRMIEKKYKFYLSFENSMCTDYITEKAYNWFESDIILVMRGDNNYSRHFPKGTFVDANDFESPEALAKFLVRLGSNEREYTRMLQLKDQFTIIPEKERSQIGYCQLCRMLNNIDTYRKTIHNIYNWWHDENVCTKEFSW